MRNIKTPKFIAIFAIVFGAFSTFYFFTETSDAQLLSDNELSNYVGAISCCKSKSIYPSGCLDCQTDGDTSFRCTSGSGFKRTHCINGTPDGCLEDEGWLSCSAKQRWWEGNDNCNGEYQEFEEQCTQDDSLGPSCDGDNR